MRYAREPLRHLFPYLPHQPGCIKRLGTVMDALIAHLAADASICAGDVVLVDSTPVECARSRETVKRSDLAGWAEYGSLRFALPVLLWAAPAPGGDQHGLPIADALTCATADERTVLGGLVPSTPAAAGCGRTVIAAKNNHGRDIESALAATGFILPRPLAPGRNPGPD